MVLCVRRVERGVGRAAGTGTEFIPLQRLVNMLNKNMLFFGNKISANRKSIQIVRRRSPRIRYGVRY